MDTEIVLKEQKSIVYRGIYNKELYKNKLLQVCRGNITTRIDAIHIIGDIQYVIVSTDLAGGIA